MVGSKDSSPTFEELARAEKDGLFRFLYWSLGHREDALDAVQEVLMRAFRAFDQVRDPTKARAWLYRIAANVAKDAQGKRRRTPRPAGVELDETVETRLTGRAEDPPDAQLGERETKEKLAQALADLAPE